MMGARENMALWAMKIARPKVLSMVSQCRHPLVLDAGCGSDSPIAAMAPDARLVGIDIFRPVLDQAKGYSALIQGNVAALPFQDGTFDVSVCIAVLEHLDRDDGKRLIADLHRVTRGIIILSCPIDEWVQDSVDGNPYQQHRYVWSLDEVRAVGWQEVHGIGLRGLSGRVFGKILRSPLGYVVGLISLLATILTYNRPRFASNVLCWKCCGIME